MTSMGRTAGGRTEEENMETGIECMFKIQMTIMVPNKSTTDNEVVKRRNGKENSRLVVFNAPRNCCRSPFLKLIIVFQNIPAVSRQ